MAQALVVLVVAIVLAWSGPANAVPFFFSTGNPDGLIGTASRPASPGKLEIESADDFAVTGANTLRLTGASFTGLLPTGASLSSVTDVSVEIYRVFPADSNVGRTSGPPTFSTSQVPTRVNSPSDVALDSRDSSAGNLTFTPAATNDSIRAGPVRSCAAIPVSTKIPVPMIAPTPRLVSWTGPRILRSR